MGEWLNLEAQDGQVLSAYRAQPQGEPCGGLVLVQEIFGVNEHMRAVADKYAREGYLVIAPALFDRLEPGVQLAYSGEGQQKAFALYGRLNTDTALLDVDAAFRKISGEVNRVGVLGFCYGGLMSWLSSTRGPALGMRPRCVVGYYAGGIGKVAEEDPSCPALLHFGAEDSHIGPDQVDAVRNAHPEVEVFVYPGAGHAFDREPDPRSFHADAAALAGDRTLAFLRAHLS